MAVNKRVAVLLIAVLLPITLIFSGCGKELTAQEYSDQLVSAFKQYAADLSEINTIQSGAGTVSELQDQQKKAKEICEKAEKTLNEFKKMKPPSQFADKHKKLISAVELEKDFLKATAKLFTASSAEEISSYTEDIEAVFSGTPEEQQFGAVFMDLFRDVQNALGN